MYSRGGFGGCTILPRIVREGWGRSHRANEFIKRKALANFQFLATSRKGITHAPRSIRPIQSHAERRLGRASRRWKSPPRLPAAQLVKHAGMRAGPTHCWTAPVALGCSRNHRPPAKLKAENALDLTPAAASSAPGTIRKTAKVEIDWHEGDAGRNYHSATPPSTHGRQPVRTHLRATPGGSDRRNVARCSNPAEQSPLLYVAG